MRFMLPIAPSTNNLYANSSGGGRHKTKEYEAWLTHAGLELNAQRSQFKRGGITLPIPPDKPAIVVIFLPLLEQADLDNRFKATLDLLKTHEIIVDDKMKYLRNVQACVDVDMDLSRMHVLVSSMEDMIKGAHDATGETHGQA